MAKKVKEKELKNLSFEANYSIDESFDNDKFIRLSMRILHDKLNPNNSYFDLQDVDRAKESVYNIPILANVIEDDSGEKQFGGHDSVVEEDSDGNMVVRYLERPIGVIPMNCDYEVKEYNGKNYVYVTGYVWKGYANEAQSIIERDKNIKVSIEITVDSYEYNEKDKYFKIKDYRYLGVTMLNNKYGTGMKDALATTGLFSDEDSDNKLKFIKMMEELKDVLTSYNDNGGENVLAHEENKTIEDVIENDSVNIQLSENEGENQALGNEGDVVVVEDNVVVEDVIVETEVVAEPIVEEPAEFTIPHYATMIDKDELDALYSKIADYEKQIESFKADIQNKDKTIDELTTFKTNVEKEIKASQVEELLGEFEAVLKDSEEFVELKKTAIDMEIAELEKELYALEGKLKHEKKNKAKDKKFNYSRVIVDVEGGGEGKEDVVAKYYGEASKYFKK